MYMTLGAPSGAFGGSNGDQSGAESRMSMLILPLNGPLMIWLLASAVAPGCSSRTAEPSYDTRVRRCAAHHLNRMMGTRLGELDLGSSNGEPIREPIRERASPVGSRP